MTTEHEQRIYIGGLDPDRLTAREVLARLNTIPGIKFETTTTRKTSHNNCCAQGDGGDEADDNDGWLDQQSFLHVQARLLQNEPKQQQQQQENVPTQEEIATAAPTTESTTMATPLQITQKLYHNVKWKGCKLTVQAAKPHFLERLAQEIQQKKQQKLKHDVPQDHQDVVSTPLQQPAPIATRDATTTTTQEQPSLTIAPPSPHRRRRQLRIRRRHGDPAIFVDTKPWQVPDWTIFDKMVRKRRRQNDQATASAVDTTLAQNNTSPGQRQQQQKLHPSTRTANINNSRATRAVHLKFVSNEDDNATGSCASDHSDSTNNSNSSSQSDESENSTSNLDHEIKESSGTMESNKTKSRYVWSDDEDDDNYQEHDKVDGNATDSSSTTSESSHSDENHPVEKSHLSLSQGDEAKRTELLLEQQAATSEKRFSLDEFASAIDNDESISVINDAIKPNEENYLDDDDDDNDDIASESSHKKQCLSVEESEDTPMENLQDDILSNLKIFSTMFPDVRVKPNIPLVDGNDGCENDTHPTDPVAKWQSQGRSIVMQRYDPTNPISAQRFERAPTMLDSKSADENNNDESKDNQKNDKEEYTPSNIENVSNSNESHTEQTATTSGYIYEEGKLEEIFRQARFIGDDRDGSNEINGKVMDNDEVMTNKDDNATSSAVGAFNGFSFGFKISPPESSPSNMTTTAAPLPPSLQDSQLTAALEEATDAGNKFVDNIDDKEVLGTSSKLETQETLTNDFLRHTETGPKVDEDNTEAEITSSPTTTPTAPAPCIAGLWLPMDVLDRYVAEFYAMNDGNRIMSDLEGYRNDPAVKEAWNRERHILTQDWKRKRKHALSRQQQNKHHHPNSRYNKKS